MYWVRKRLLSQNFLINRELIQRLIRSSSISPTDTVLEIGAGCGALTQELAKIADKVIAVEIDPKLAEGLPKHKNIVPVCQNILEYSLPLKPYKVFSNIPFTITGDIIRKLLQSPNPPQDCFLITQSQAADKFTIHPHANTMAALLYYPWWEITITHKFNRFDFRPVPKVDSVLLHLKPKAKPLVPVWQKSSYYDLVAYHFIHHPQAKFIPPALWLSRFKHHLPASSGAFAKLLKEQNQLHKIHRSRTAKNWQSF